MSKNIKNALILAIIVGTILNAINSYDVILDGNLSSRTILKIILTYITPFCVSLYSSNKATKSFKTQIKINPVAKS
jgi:hypothetical protein